MKKHSLLILLLFPFSAGSMLREIDPHNRRFIQNNGADEARCDRRQRISRLKAQHEKFRIKLDELNKNFHQAPDDRPQRISILEAQVDALNKNVSELQHTQARMLDIASNLVEEQEAKKNLKVITAQQEARKTLYGRIYSSIPVLLRRTTVASGSGAGVYTAEKMYDLLCPTTIKKAPVVGAALRAGALACGGCVGASITQLVINNSPKNLEECRIKYDTFMRDVRRADGPLGYSGSFMEPRTWLVQLLSKNNSPARLFLEGGSLLLKIAAGIENKLRIQ